MFRIPVERRPQKIAAQSRIAVAGLSAGCGASFAAGSAAFELAQQGLSCTLAELCSPYFFHALNIEKRFAGGGFVFYEDLLASRRTLLTVKNEYRGINLLLRRPDAPGFAPAMSALKMPGEHVVFDLSGASEGYLDEVLPEMDSIVLIIDPLPSKLLPAAKKLEALRMQYPDIKLAVNKMNPGVHLRELKRFLGTENFIRLELLPVEQLYKAEYNCVLPAELHGKNTGFKTGKDLIFL